MKVVSGLGATRKISSASKGGTTVKICFPFGPPFGYTWNFSGRSQTWDYFHKMSWSIQNPNLTLNCFEEFLRLFRGDFPDCVYCAILSSKQDPIFLDTQVAPSDYNNKKTIHENGLRRVIVTHGDYPKTMVTKSEIEGIAQKTGWQVPDEQLCLGSPGRHFWDKFSK